MRAIGQLELYIRSETVLEKIKKLDIQVKM